MHGGAQFGLRPSKGQEEDEGPAFTLKEFTQIPTIRQSIHSPKAADRIRVAEKNAILAVVCLVFMSSAGGNAMKTERASNGLMTARRVTKFSGIQYNHASGIHFCVPLIRVVTGTRHFLNSHWPQNTKAISFDGV